MTSSLKSKIPNFIYLIFIATLLMAWNGAWANSRTDYIGVDFRDVAKYSSQSFPEARIVLNAIKLNPEEFFGPEAKDISNIYGIELYDSPIVGATFVTLPVVILVETPQEGFYFRKLQIETSRHRITNINLAADDLKLLDTHFKVTVGVYQRKVILEDLQNQIKIIYPLGLGGVDDITSPDKVKFSTPEIAEGYIEKKFVIKARTEPTYYKGKPFLAVSRPEGHPTGIAFHIEINNQFRRSFESHGCMRLREKDLMEFFNIVMHTQNPTRVEIFLDLPGQGDHPFPLHNASYERFKNFGTAADPIFKRSKQDHLMIMERVVSTPPWLRKPQSVPDLIGTPMSKKLSSL